jgi:NtrC-family two-component system response regulator AlgB
MELKVGKFDSVLLDLNLGRENGHDILEQIHKCQPNLPVITFTAQGSVKNAVEAMRRGAVDFLEKPFSPEQFRLVLARVQRFQQLNQKIERLEREDLPAELRGQTGSGAKFWNEPPTLPKPLRSWGLTRPRSTGNAKRLDWRANCKSRLSIDFC